MNEPSAAVTANATMERLRGYGQEGNPPYPSMGATVEKFRRMARHAGGVMSMDKVFRDQYADAIEARMISLQRAQLYRAISVPRPNCASGTYFSAGADIERAVIGQQRARLSACPSQERRARKPEVWKSMYEDAMAVKAAQQVCERKVA